MTRRGLPGLVIWVALATLPGRYRDRYRAEFAAELHFVPRGQRLLYAVRVLVRAWALHAALTAQPATIGEIMIPTKPLKCRLHLHKWKVRHNEEDGSPYQECVRCTEQREVPTVHRAGGFAGLQGGM
jgi:hypothetical protein